MVYAEGSYRIFFFVQTKFMMKGSQICLSSAMLRLRAKISESSNRDQSQADRFSRFKETGVRKIADPNQKRQADRPSGRNSQTQP